MVGTEATVFVVDDEPTVNASIASSLNEFGIRTETFVSARQFLEQFDRTRPGCLVLDLKLPDMDGIELHRMIRERDGMLPVIFFSGKGSIPDVSASMRGGAIDFLVKPVDIDVLVNRVREALTADEIAREKQEFFVALRKRMETFSPRERQVAGFVIDGMTAKEISKELGIETKTVEVHRSRLVRKAASGSTLEFVRDLASFGIRTSKAFSELIPAKN